MSNVVGGWELAPMQPCNLPEEVATGFTEVTHGLVGAKYVPVFYVGKQIVQGTNYMVLCKQTIVVPGAPEHLVEMVLNHALDGSWSIVTIKQIV